jgi:hypothetical protein
MDEQLKAKHFASIAFASLCAVVFCPNRATSQQTLGTARQSAAQISATSLVDDTAVPTNSDGLLHIGSSTVRFSAGDQNFEINRRRIISAEAGEERVETGGTPGRIARMVIPYGGGQALGTVTHKKVGLLTIEYLDPQGLYHGAVFRMSPDEASMAALDLSEQSKHAGPSEHQSLPCNIGSARRDSIVLSPIQTAEDLKIPAEDRVLLYERLFTRLSTTPRIRHVYRAGDSTHNARCAESRIIITATQFKKGNQAVRASVGPLGYFVGNTRIAYHLRIASADGTILVDRDMKSSQGSDSDSLDVTKAISKAISKCYKKARNNHAEASVSG